jgi:hypothetical protein
MRTLAGIQRLDAILTLAAVPPGSNRSGDLPAHPLSDGIAVHSGQCRLVSIAACLERA